MRIPRSVGSGSGRAGDHQELGAGQVGAGDLTRAGAPTVQNLTRAIEGMTYEHTGGGCHTLFVGPFAIGPFHQSGEPCDGVVYVTDERDGADVTCATVEQVADFLAREA